MRKIQLYWHKLTHWEYWSFEAVYFPVFFVWLYYAMRARSFFFFNASNPSIKNGGFLMESKKDIYDLIPSEYYPKTLLFSPTAQAGKIVEAMQASGIAFPCIAKPDIGMKGLAVEKLACLEDLQAYLQKIKVDFLIQSFVDYPQEVGIFYYRLPYEKTGHISGIVHKEFLTVVGNGKDTVLALLENNPRFALQVEVLQKMYGETLLNVLPTDEMLTLVPYGNHARGAKFIDATHWASPELQKTIDLICQQIPDFYYGRLDIKYNTWEGLQAGKDFAIIELNGAGSEPTHIYDPKHSLYWAWRESIKHLHLLFKISVYNKKQGHQYLSNKEGFKMFRENKILLQKLKSF
ncbi:MAG: D-alanine--D-alanine ligase [Bacteroidetes bacterium]|nr:MAG: D-alanine--D-alanine ligase [Bacteroidota bacterium]